MLREVAEAACGALGGERGFTRPKVQCTGLSVTECSCLCCNTDCSCKCRLNQRKNRNVVRVGSGLKQTLTPSHSHLPQRRNEMETQFARVDL